MPGTATWRRLRDMDADWTVEVSMLAAVLHTLQVANWQRGADAREGKQKKHYPQPILSPSQREKDEAKRDRPAQSVGKLMQFRERTYARGA